MSDPENPTPTMDTFFCLYQSVRVASSDLHTIPWLRGQEDTDPSVDEDKLKSPMTWVNAALSVDLASIAHFSKHFASVLKRSSPRKDSMISNIGLFSSKKANELLSSSQLTRGASSPSVRRTPSSTPQKGYQGTERLSSSQELRNPSPLKASSLKRSLGTSGAENIVKAAGFLLGDPTSKKTHSGNGSTISTTTLELANLLRSEMQSWFLQYVEKALEFGFRLSFVSVGSGHSGNDVVADEGSSELKIAQKESNVIALMLSQIKRVNDWVDVIETDKEKPLDMHVIQILDRVKRKIYEFLLQHVESAATTLGKCI